MPDTVDTAIYKLGYDTGNSVQQLNQTRQAAEGLVTTTEKLDKSSRTTSAGFDRLIGRYDATARATQTYERELSRVARYEAEGIGTAAQHAVIRDKVTAAYNAEMMAARAAAGQLSATEKATAAVSTVTADLQAKVQGMTAQFGVFGQAAAALGPVGIGIAVGFGAAVLAFNQMSTAAHNLAQKAIELHDFSTSTGLTTLQVQALRKEAVSLGLSTDTIEAALQKGTVAFEEFRSGGGKTLELLRRYKPELVDQIASTEDYSEAITLLGKAYEGLTTSQQNALSRSFFGKAGIEMSRLVNGLDLKKLTDDFDAAGKGLDDGLIKRLRELELKITDVKRQSDINFSKLFSEDLLKLELAFWETLVKISETIKDIGKITPDPASLIAGLLSAAGGAALGRFIGDKLANLEQTPKRPISAGGAGGTLIGPLGTATEQGSGGALGRALNPPIEKTPEFIAKAMQETIQALGAAATETEKYNLSVLQLNIALKNGVVNQDEYNRALKALDIQSRTMASLADQLAVAQAITAEQRLAATEKAKYNEMVRDGVSAENATARAAGERAIAQAQINTQAKQQLQSLEDQYRITTAVTGQEQMRVQYEVTIDKLLRDGVDALTAQKIAAQELENSQLAINKSVMDQARSLNQQTDLAEARLRGDEASVAAAQAYANAIKQGADSMAAAALAAATMRSYTQKAAEDAMRMQDALDNAENAAADAYMAKSAGQKLTVSGTDVHFVEARGQPGGISLDQLNNMLGLNVGNQFGSFNDQVDFWQNRYRGLGEDQLKGMEGQYGPNTAVGTAIRNLVEAMDRNTDATTGNTLALSPFYSQQGDHLLGYRGYSASQSDYTISGALPIASSPPTAPAIPGYTPALAQAPKAANSTTAAQPIIVNQTFFSAPKPDEVRQSAFQALQGIRRTLGAA